MRFRRFVVLGKVAENAALFFAAEGRIGHDDIDPVSVADLAQRKAQAVQRIDLGDSRPCKTRFICASRYGSGLASPPKML